MRKSGLALVVTLGSLSVFVACGGSSESSFSDPGGSSSGGSAAAHAGTQNSAAGADDGAAGDGAPSGQGGTSAGGRGGTAGAAGGPLMPDPTVREGCDEWCAGVTEAACDETTLDDCMFGCRAIVGSPACNGRYGDLFECAEGATFSCNADGDAVPQGCEIEYAQVGLCVFSNPDETIAEPCEAYCVKQEAAECTNSTPAAECTYGCQLTSSLVPACAEDWKTFIDCAQGAEVTCNADGDATPAACGIPYLDYLSCLLEAGQ